MDESEDARRLAVLMRGVAGLIQEMRLGCSLADLGQGMVIAGLELWLEAVGPEQLALHLADQAKQYEIAAQAEGYAGVEPPSAH